MPSKAHRTLVCAHLAASGLTPDLLRALTRAAGPMEEGNRLLVVPETDLSGQLAAMGELGALTTMLMHGDS